MSRVKHCEYLLNILKMLYPELREDSHKAYYIWCDTYLVVNIGFVYFRIHYSIKRENKVIITVFSDTNNINNIKGIFHNMFKISRDYSYKNRQTYVLHLPKEESK